MADTQELNLDQKVTVRNIANWPVTFARIDGIGDIIIPPNATARLTRNEIISQAQTGNRLFVGADGLGSHATLIVEDAPTKVELGFESEDGKTTQNVFTDAKVKELFALKTKAAFEKRLVSDIVTRAEKKALIEAAKRMKLNDFEKVRAIEAHTGFKM